MKNKGFTLVELLAVIVILAVISIITIPLIGNVIKDSKKKALETSVYGLVEAANYYAINHTGVSEFIFGENKKGETIQGEKLNYKGKIDAEGSLYIDSNGDISLCLKNEEYYVYKNYNSGIYTGNISEDSCTVKFDSLTNKYIAYLESEGEGINVYTKEEVNNLIDSVNINVTNNTNEITSIKENITNLQTDISNYALKSELDGLSSVVSNNIESINDLNSNLNNTIRFIDYSNATSICGDTGVGLNYTVQDNGFMYYGYAINEKTHGFVLVNGQKIHHFYSEAYTQNSIVFPVSKGDVITTSNLLTQLSILYPAK